MGKKVEKSEEGQREAKTWLISERVWGLVLISFITLSRACMMLVWSRPPKRRPTSSRGNLDSVNRR